MATPNCWRCLTRPSQRLLTAPTPSSPTTKTTAVAAAFSTSAHQYASPKPRSNEPNMNKHIRAGKKLVLGKKKRTPDGKPVAPGERKAFRKRIQLSNDNALEVPGHDDLTVECLVNPDSIGKMFKMPNGVIDKLRTWEAFKPTQNWGFFRAPHMLVRNETVDLMKQMTDAVEKKETLRLVVTGDRGSGKSSLSLQALATGFIKNWIVIHVPEGQELTNGSTEYSSVPRSNFFSQPMATIKLMQSIHQTSGHILSQQKVIQDHMHLPIANPRGSTLAALLTATKDPDSAWAVFQAFWKELLLPGRPPILFSLDGLAHIMQNSVYRSPAFEIIHAHELGLVSLFADALGGKIAFPNGAAILGITSKGNAPIIATMNKALEQASAAQKGEEIPARDPFYRKYDERVFESLKGVRILDINGVSKTEARSLMEYWASSGVYRSRVDEKNVAEKWTMAGGGILAEMERVALYPIRA
ncbi:mitochondrial ribosomal death-associated protein 3-domain-containing protein [Xylariaceae sp. FL0255]|nr:mitochondrial ribosomal death-associated protein 3-domain-containing protein [Xylariaceae sp. FL0255]